MDSFRRNVSWVLGFFLKQLETVTGKHTSTGTLADTECCRRAMEVLQHLAPEEPDLPSQEAVARPQRFYLS